MDVCLSLLSAVRCQVEAPASGWQLVQTSPTEWEVCLSVIAEPRKVGHDPESGRSATGKENYRMWRISMRWKTIILTRVWSQYPVNNFVPLNFTGCKISAFPSNIYLSFFFFGWVTVWVGRDPLLLAVSCDTDNVLQNSSFHSFPCKCAVTSVRNPLMYSTSLDFA